VPERHQLKLHDLTAAPTDLNSQLDDSSNVARAEHRIIDAFGPPAEGEGPELTPRLIPN
jgi:hypothetical protein